VVIIDRIFLVGDQLRRDSAISRSSVIRESAVRSSDACENEAIRCVVLICYRLAVDIFRNRYLVSICIIGIGRRSRSQHPVIGVIRILGCERR
jgi:hypothetical protein